MADILNTIVYCINKSIDVWSRSRHSCRYQGPSIKTGTGAFIDGPCVDIFWKYTTSYTSELNGYPLAFYSWTFKFHKVMRQQIRGEGKDHMKAFFWSSLQNATVKGLLKSVHICQIFAVPYWSRKVTKPRKAQTKLQHNWCTERQIIFTLVLFFNFCSAVLWRKKTVWVFYFDSRGTVITIVWRDPQRELFCLFNRSEIGLGLLFWTIVAV